MSKVDFTETKRSLNRLKDRAERAEKRFTHNALKYNPLTKKERQRKWERAYNIINDQAQTHISKVNR